MIYIVGANHRFQFINNQTDLIESEQFRDYIIEHIQSKNIDCVAEEMNDEWLVTKWNTTRCVCREIAEGLGIVHIMCDPNTEERQSMGYDAIDKNQWRKREAFWFTRIEPYPNRTILFICGPDHVFSFSEVLREKGIEVEVICERYQPN